MTSGTAHAGDTPDTGALPSSVQYTVAPFCAWIVTVTLFTAMYGPEPLAAGVRTGVAVRAKMS